MVIDLGLEPRAQGLRNKLISGHSTSHSSTQSEREKDTFSSWGVQGLPTGTCLVSLLAGPAVLTCPEITDH